MAPKASSTKPVEKLGRIEIPVNVLEFIDGGNTIWIHSPKGVTVMRIKTSGKIVTRDCEPLAVVSHSDVTVEGDIDFCLAKDDRPGHRRVRKPLNIH